MLSDRIASLRRQAGWSQEELAERLDVSRQSVSKWESGASQPEVDKIVSLSRLFGVSTDYLLREEADEPVLVELVPERAPADANEEDDDGLRALEEGEVFRYLENRRQCAPQIALGVGLCVACAAPMMALMGTPLPEKLAIALGLFALLGLIAAGVALFVSTGMRMQKYDYVEKPPFALTEALRAAILEQKQDFMPIYKQGITHGVVLCILSPVPVVAGGILDKQWMILGGVAALLLLVAAGVFLFVREGMILESFDNLLKGAERSRRIVERQRRRANRVA